MKSLCRVSLLLHPPSCWKGWCFWSHLLSPLTLPLNARLHLIHSSLISTCRAAQRQCAVCVWVCVWVPPPSLCPQWVCAQPPPPKTTTVLLKELAALQPDEVLISLFSLSVFPALRVARTHKWTTTHTQRDTRLNTHSSLTLLLLLLFSVWLFSGHSEFTPQTTIHQPLSTLCFLPLLFLFEACLV